MNPTVLPPVVESQDDKSKDVWSSAPTSDKYQDSQARTYNQDTWGQFLLASQNPEPWKLCKAAEILYDHFSGLNFRFAFMGGFALYLRGSARLPKDVDITVPQNSVDRAVAVLRRSANVCIPDPVTEGFRTTVFVNCLPWVYPPPLVRVDIVISGSLSMPANIKVFSERIRPRQGWTSDIKLPSVVVIHSTVNAKLHSHFDRRRYTSTDFHDLLWLVRNYESIIRENKDLYYIKHYDVFVETAYAYSETWGDRVADVFGRPRPARTREHMAQVAQARARLQLEDALIF